MDDLQYLDYFLFSTLHKLVLNLVINGWPSIPAIGNIGSAVDSGFKPCYKWMTFNTEYAVYGLQIAGQTCVLNLVINGWPSILNTLYMDYKLQDKLAF